jgi:hypothetical protein
MSGCRGFSSIRTAAFEKDHWMGMIDDVVSVGLPQNTNHV